MKHPYPGDEIVKIETVHPIERYKKTDKARTLIHAIETLEEQGDLEVNLVARNSPNGGISLGNLDDLRSFNDDDPSNHYPGNTEIPIILGLIELGTLEIPVGLFKVPIGNGKSVLVRNEVGNLTIRDNQEVILTLEHESALIDNMYTKQVSLKYDWDKEMLVFMIPYLLLYKVDPNFVKE